MKGFLPSYSCLNCVSYLSSHVSDFSHLCIDFCSSYKHSSLHIRVSMFEVETDVLFLKNELTLLSMDWYLSSLYFARICSKSISALNYSSTNLSLLTLWFSGSPLIVGICNFRSIVIGPELSQVWYIFAFSAFFIMFQNAILLNFNC